MDLCHCRFLFCADPAQLRFLHSPDSSPCLSLLPRAKWEIKPTHLSAKWKRIRPKFRLRASDFHFEAALIKPTSLFWYSRRTFIKFSYLYCESALQICGVEHFFWPTLTCKARYATGLNQQNPAASPAKKIPKKTKSCCVRPILILTFMQPDFQWKHPRWGAGTTAAWHTWRLGSCWFYSSRRQHNVLSFTSCFFLWTKVCFIIH